MKLSFLDRLTGGSSPHDGFDAFDEELSDDSVPTRKESHGHGNESTSRGALFGEDPSGSEGQLPVDVHKTANEIIVRAFVAGVRPDELNISITREMVEIEGSRTERGQIANPDYFARELFWGSFSRSIMLPEEVDVEGSSATVKDGLLTITLPKLDRARQTKLRVKVG